MNIELTKIYYDHYKDTFEKILQEKGNRLKYFFAMLFLILLLFLTIYVPQTAIDASNEVVKKTLGSNIVISFEWIKTLLIFSFVWLSFLYYQATLNIERLYLYLHKVEGRLSRKMASLTISREGEDYLYKYPMVLSVIHRMYFIAVPLSIIFLFSYRWILDNFKDLQFWTINNYIDSFSELIIVLTAVLFFLRLNITPLIVRKTGK